MNAESLKKSILQWAIEGKLVPQLENEVAVNQIGEAPEDVPFAIPKKWKWMRFGDLGVLSSPRRVHKSDWKSEGVPFLRARELAYLAETGKLLNELFIDPELFEARRKKGETPEGGDLLLTAVGTLGKCYVVKDDDVFFCKDTNTLRFAKHNQSPYFLQLLFQSPYIRALIDRTAVGSTVKNLTIGVMNKWLIPVPPIEEQHRIVERLNELLPLVDTYGKEYEALMKLNKELPGRLRASILQEAIQGKLVPQLDEEPAVKQIGEAPKEVPFAIPEKWKWVQLKNLVDVTKQKIPDKDFLYLDVSGVAPNKKSIQSLSAIKANDAPSRARKIVKEGMVLFSTVRPYFLKTVVAENLDLEKETIASTAFAIFSCKNELLNKFIWLVLQSPYFLEYVTSCQKGSTYPAITDKLFYSAYVPLPPVEEQRRIVQKVIELLGEVEKLS